MNRQLRTLVWMGVIVVALSVAAGVGAQTPSGTGTGEVPLLTLSEATEIALQRSERMVEARDDLQQAKLSVNLASSFFSPKLVPNVVGSFGQTNQANQTYQLTLSKRFITGTEIRANLATTSLRNQLGNFWNTDTTFSVRQPILRDFGRSVTGQHLARSKAHVRETERRSTLTARSLVLQVAGAYYGIVRQERLVDVAEKTLERSRELLAASRAKLQAGRVSQLDVFRAEQLAAEAEGQLLDARATRDDSRDLFRDLLEVDHNYDFRVDMDIPRPVKRFSLDEAVEIAVANSLEIRIAEDAIAESERAVAYAKNQLLPQLDLGVAALRGQTAEDIGSTFGLKDYEVATFVTASAPVDRTAETIAYNNALIDRDRRRRDLSRLLRRTTSEARRAARQVDRLYRRLELAESKVQFAESEVEVATERYRRGFANNLDVVNAELALLTAQTNMLATRAEAALAELQLEATLGILPLETTPGTR